MPSVGNRYDGKGFGEGSVGNQEMFVGFIALLAFIVLKAPLRRRIVECGEPKTRDQRKTEMGVQKSEVKIQDDPQRPHDLIHPFRRHGSSNPGLLRLLVNEAIRV